MMTIGQKRSFEGERRVNLPIRLKMSGRFPSKTSNYAIRFYSDVFSIHVTENDPTRTNMLDQDTFIINKRASPAGPFIEISRCGNNAIKAGCDRVLKSFIQSGEGVTYQQSWITSRTGEDVTRLGAMATFFLYIALRLGMYHYHKRSGVRKPYEVWDRRVWDILAKIDDMDTETVLSVLGVRKFADFSIDVSSTSSKYGDFYDFIENTSKKFIRIAERNRPPKLTPESSEEQPAQSEPTEIIDITAAVDTTTDTTAANTTAANTTNEPADADAAACLLNMASGHTELVNEFGYTVTSSMIQDVLTLLQKQTGCNVLQKICYGDREEKTKMFRMFSRMLGPLRQNGEPVKHNEILMTLLQEDLKKISDELSLM